jgi:micrococcal nuclease
MHDYLAKVIKIVDGDTIDCDVDLGFHTYTRVRLRFARINTPELRGAEKEAGKAAKQFVVEKLVQANDTIMIQTQKTGKYGRWIAEVFYTPEEDDKLIKNDSATFINLNDELVNNGHAEYTSYN